LASVLCGGRFTAAIIFSLRYGFCVLGIYAGPIAAKMIRLKVVWYGTDEDSAYYAVCPLETPFVLNHAVAIRLRRNPWPALSFVSTIDWCTDL
jgi:hypothetical protein